jgi:light-harvesting complex I chlorophyll a/b binding protein 1
MSLAMRSTSTSMAGRRAAAPMRNVAVKAGGNWSPGTPKPAWLPADLPANFGFDPLGLGKDSASLDRFREAEVIHGRWAMLGAAGCFAVELAGQGSWADAPLWAINGGSATYLGSNIPFDLTTIAGVEVVGMAIAEGRRAEADFNGRVYPGGAFDPAGMSKDAKSFETMKIKEIKNGRLAMVAFVGFICQHAATGKSPLEALAAHSPIFGGNPWVANFATNGVSIPGL